ncbi:MAG: urate hydroxylase PuuD [Armatimonadota bacterium]|nr:urate hydroxylase PuuD [Armatimonadota bacterium]MDR7528736.1 urate hydroxylase PuuD [Armatimonadota bacterium]
MAVLTGEGVLFLLRWIHFLAGIAWIGLLYYFNLVQTPYFAEAEATVRSGMLQKLVPRALWWFRWGAMVTFLSGWIIILHRIAQGGFFAGSYGWAILLGGLLGSLMWANVWFVIWPNQKVVIQNAIDTAAGRPANPAAAAAGARAGLTSRTNTMLSIPMLFYMGAASHLTGLPVPRNGVVFWVVALVILAAIEVNALTGKPGEGAAKPLATVSGTLWAGFILALIYYLLFEVMR